MTQTNGLPWWIILMGIILFLISLPLDLSSHTTVARWFYIFGIGLIGLGIGPLVRTIIEWYQNYANKKSLNNILRRLVKIKEPKKKKPIMFLIDIEGCITPPKRDIIDLSRLARLRAYCEFVKSSSGEHFPPIVIITGRSQGYVECLSQCLSLINPDFDLPFIIENGTALYYPAAKRTELVIDTSSLNKLNDIRKILEIELPMNIFEPKLSCITVNNAPGEAIEALRDKIVGILHSKGFNDQVFIRHTATAVDITPIDINKASPLSQIINIYSKLRGITSPISLEDVVAIIDSSSDLPVAQKVGRVYCPAENVATDVRNYVENKASQNQGHVISRNDIDFVVHVIEKECGIEII